MRRRVILRFADLPVRYKFLLVAVPIAGIAVAAHSWMAISLFTEDKKPFVYEGSAQLAESLAQETATDLASSARTLRLIASAYNQVYATDKAKEEAVRAIFDADDQLVEALIYDLAENQTFDPTTPPSFEMANATYLAPYGLPADYLTTLRKTVPVSIDFASSSRLSLQGSSAPSGIPLLRMSLLQTVSKRGKAHDTDQLIIGHLRQDQRIKLFGRSPIYATSLIDRYGHYLSHADTGKVMRGESLTNLEWLDSIRKYPAPTGVMDLKAPNGEDIIVAFSRLQIGDLIVLSEIPRAKAFQATAILTKKSLIFAAQIMFAAIIVSLIFTVRMTRSLRKLQVATGKAANGDFDINLKIEGKDEVGSLSRSFNHMATEIKRLLIATADKARMEKELETAHLVQDNFFPIAELQVGDIEIAAHFQAASECGGDWWGQFTCGNQLIVLIGDATGHGVPSALITAAAYSCSVTLNHLADSKDIGKLSAKTIMTALNLAVIAAGKGKIKMTFFVGVLDLTSGLLTYCNASHESPLIVRLPEGHPADEPRPKDALDTLTSKPDPVLGKDAHSEYCEYQTTVGPGDVLLWYTDGLVEGRNKEGQEFGENRLLRTFAKVAHLSIVEARAEVLRKASEFWDSVPNDDDITLIVLKRQIASAKMLAAG